MTSQEDRRGVYTNLRFYYLWGCDSGAGDPAIFNKIQPHIDTLASFLFSSDTTRFSTELGVSADKSEVEKVPPMDGAVMNEWLNSNADMVALNAIKWALVFNSAFVKLIWDKGMHPYFVDPACVGVLREDNPYLDRQDAIVHEYYSTRANLRRDLERAGHEHVESIMSQVNAIQTQPEEESGLQRVINLSASQPNVIGNLTAGPFQPKTDYLPKVDEPLVKMQELWVWDDDEEDYRVITMADGEIIIYDRKNFWLDGEHPFVQFCPRPLPNYLWGESEVDRLTTLQDLLNWRMNQIKQILDKSANPPVSTSGMLGITDEKMAAYNMPGGYFDMGDTPMGKFDPHPPTMPNDLFAEVQEIFGMFAEVSGLQNIMMGKAERGVRTRGQTSELAKLGSSRIKQRAMIVEDSLERMATLYAKAIQVYSKRTLTTQDGQEFIPAQFTDDYTVKVDAHSNSPIFVEDHKAQAAEMLEMKVIDRETYVELVNPPMKQLILTRLKKIEAAEMQAHQKQEQLALAGVKESKLKSVKS
jgi:hypothetical protein